MVQLDFRDFEIFYQIVGSILLVYSVIKATDKQVDIISRFTYGGNSKLSASIFQQREHGRLGVMFLLFGSIGQLILSNLRIDFLVFTVGIICTILFLVLFVYWLKKDEVKFINKLLRNRKKFQESRDKSKT